MEIIMVLFYLLGHENTMTNGHFKKTRGIFCENIRTKWNGFICRQTGFIRQRTGFIRRADEASPPADEASPLADEAIHIGPNIFFQKCHFSLMFSFCLQQEIYHQNQRKKCFF